VQLLQSVSVIEKYVTKRSITPIVLKPPTRLRQWQTHKCYSETAMGVCFPRHITLV